MSPLSDPVEGASSPPPGPASSDGRDPLDVILENVAGPQEPPPGDDRADRLAEALDALGIGARVAARLGWEWCPDSRDLPGIQGPARARPYAGIVGPRTTFDGPAGWFFVAVPPMEDAPVVTPVPTNVLAVLPQPDQRLPLHLAADPIAAARLFEAGHAAAWIRGHNGWRDADRRPLAALTAVAGRAVVLHPDGDCWREAPVFDAWRALSEALAEALGEHGEVRVATPSGECPAAEGLDRSRRPATERQREQRRIRDDLGRPRAFRKAEFADALARADERFVSKRVEFVGRGGGLRAQELARAVVECLGHVARGPGGPWAYDAGVWRPAWSREEGSGGAIGMLVVRLLGNDYRPSHEEIVVRVLVRLPDLPHLAAHPVTDGWDGVLNFTNGLVDPLDPQLRPHDPAVLSTWQLPVAYEPTAACPQFRRFLAEVLPADMLEEEDGVAAWQEDFGYLLLPGNPMHVAFLLRGSGRNGKGVWTDVAKALVGPDAVSTLSLEDMVAGDRSRFRLAQLVGSALNVCSELDPKYLDSTAAFKSLTGGDAITVEEKHRKPFTYAPWATPVFSANEDFPSVDRSVAYFERWQVRAFPTFIPSERRDPRLAKRLIAEELPGIAAAAVAGLRVLLERGRFREVASAGAQKQQFRRYSDHVLRFLEERVVFGPTETEARSRFYDSYTSWCEDEGIKRPITRQQLLAALRKHAAEQGVDVEEAKSHGSRHLRGARLVGPEAGA